MLFALLLVVGNNRVLAQTPTSTITNTPAPFPTVGLVTSTPTATGVPPNLDCPDFPVYFDEVDLTYARMCSRCLSERPTPTRGISHGLPSYDIPVTALYTPTNTPTGTLTITPDTEATYYPTVTPPGFVASNTPLPGLFTPSRTPTITPSPTLTATSTPELTFINFYDADAALGDWELFYGAYTANAPGFGYEFNVDEYRLDNPLGGGYEALGFQLFTTTGSVYVRTIEYDLYLPVRGCTDLCGYHAQTFINHFGGGLDGYYLGYGISYGYPFYTSGYAEGVLTHHVITVNDYVGSIEWIMGQYQSGTYDSHGNYGADYVRNVFIDYDPFGFETPEPTDTPTQTYTPDGADTATPTITPTPPGFIDCSKPFGVIDRSDMMTVEFGTFSGESCPLTIFPGIDLRDATTDDRLVIPQIDLCIKWVTMPQVNIFGIPIPIGMVIAALVVGFIFHALLRF